MINQRNNQSSSSDYSQNLCGRLTSFTNPLGTVGFTYDANGNVLTVNDANGTITRSYDNMDRVTSVTDVNGKTVKYGYDELGNILSLTYPGGEIVRYTYNPDSSLESFVDGAGRKTSYTYDRQGRKETETRPDGSAETTVYNDKNQIESVEDRAKDGTLLQKYEYTYDGFGNITSIKENVKPEYDVDHTPEAFGVDADVKEETKEEKSTVETKEETQEDGTVIKTTTTTTVTESETTVISNMEYNEVNQLVRFNGNDVEYDADGNMVYGPLSGEMTTFTYDCRNRLISAGGATYCYDAENVRISVETEDYTEEYTTDRVYPLCRTLEIVRTPKNNPAHNNSTENNSSVGATNKTTTITCYYGTGLVYDAVNTSPSKSGNSTGTNLSQDEEVRIYHFNHLGSTRYITDKDGNKTWSFNYGTYGEFLGCYDAGGNEVSLRVLETPVRFLYNGELGVTTDDNTLLYMRQRYYNPEIKRFINQDVLTGTITNSLSLNRYSYVEGNPISYTDPFGLSKIRDTLKSIHSTYRTIKNSIVHMNVHTTLNLLGTIPGVGALFDVANAALYAMEGKTKEALESLIFAIPTMDIICSGGSKVVEVITKAIKISGTLAATTISLYHTTEGVAALYNNYIKTGRPLDLEGLSMLFGTSVSAFQTSAFSKSLVNDLSKISSLEGTGESKPFDAGPEWDDPPEIPRNTSRTTDFYSGPNGTARSLEEYDKMSIVGEEFKIHGNSKLSTKPQHGYEIFNVNTGDVVKTGISGQKLNNNRTSPRANSQVNKLNKLAGEKIYDARVVIKDLPNRASALEWEKQNALRLWKEHNSMAIHKRPKPWED